MSILLQDLKYGTRLLLIGILVLAGVRTVVPTFRSAVLHAQNVDTKAAAAANMRADREVIYRTN